MLFLVGVPSLAQMRYKRRYRQRRTHAGQLLGDTSYIANRLPWELAMAFGVILFTLFYWAVPAWINQHLDSLQGNQYRPIAEALFARRVHWFQWLGIALGLICTFFAIRNYFLIERLDCGGEHRAAFISRIIARLLD